MNNLILLKKHQKRIVIMLSIMVFLFVYTIIVIVEITAVYFINRNEDKALILQSDRVKAIVKTYDTITTTGDSDLDKIVEDVLKNTYVYSTQGVLVDTIGLENMDTYIFPLQSITRIQGWKFYKTTTLRDNVTYYLITAREYKSILSQVGLVFIIMFIVSPIFFGLLMYISRRITSNIYRPLEEVITNLESFAGNINHEFKTGLSEIISSLELAKVTGEYADANTYAVESSYRLNSTLDSLGSLIHFVNSDYRKEKVDLITLLEGCLEDFTSLMEDKNITIMKKYNEKKKIYKYIDTSPLILTFQNIFKNAIKYSHQDGKIDIHITDKYFTIKDYGVGIAKENLDKIFERYFQESYMKTGDGIGLSIIHHITKIYNWRIDIKSKKDLYTEVTIKF